LSTNRTLLYLCLISNETYSRVIKAISELLEVNKAIQVIGLTKFPSESYEELLKDDKRSRIIFIHKYVIDVSLPMNEDIGTGKLAWIVKHTEVFSNFCYSYPKAEKKDVKNIAETLKVNTSIKKASCSFHYASKEHGSFFGETLKVNKKLNLGVNRVYLEGAEVLSEALKVNTYLKDLNLEGSFISDEELRAIVEALKVNKTIESLIIS
jgi:hypothetical protein